MSICFTYRNAGELREVIKSGKIGVDGPIITASAANVKMFFSCVPDGKRSCFNCCSVKDLTYNLLPKWCSKNSEEKLRQLLEYGNVIRQCKSSFSDKEFSSFQRNAYQVIDGMRLLLEMDIYPNDFQPEDKQETLFKIIYEAFIKNNTAQEFQNKKYEWLYRKDFINALVEISPNLNKIYDKDYFKFSQEAFLCRRVYFHGFISFSPLENFLIKCFEKNGIDVCYVNYWDENEIAAFDILKENPHFQKLDKRCFFAKADKKGRYSGIFANSLAEQEKEILPKIYKFNDIFSLVSVLDNSAADISLLCPSGLDMENFQKTFFGEGERKKFISYPMGQYLYCIYDMWDSSTERLNIKADNIRQCLATGYALGSDLSAGELMTAFQQAHAIFEECSSVSDWKYMLDLWKSNYNNSVPRNENGSEESRAFSRWNSIMDNIWRNAGPFAMDKSVMEALIISIQCILRDIERLLDNKAITYTESHNDGLHRLISSKYHLIEPYEEQKKLLFNALDDIARNLLSVKLCHTTELCNAMKLVLSGAVKAEQKEIMEGIYLGEIEAYLLRMNHSSKYLVAFCDAHHLPGMKASLPWPLCEEFFLNVSDGNFEFIEDYLFAYNSRQLEGRYLFYLALQLPNADFSWVAEIDGKAQIMSPYLALLNSLGSEIIPSAGSLLRSDNNADNAFGCVTGKYIPMDSFRKTPTEVRANDLFCPYRNIYDYVFSRYPSFNSKFQLQFFVTAAIKVIYDSVGYIAPNRKARNMTDISKEVFTKLPLWNVTEKMYILDFARKYGLLYKMKNYETGSFDMLEPIQDNMGMYYYKSDRIFAKYLNRYTTQKIIKTIQQTKKTADIPPMGNCIYCPHNECCCFQEKKKRY